LEGLQFVGEFSFDKLSEGAKGVHEFGFEELDGRLKGFECPQFFEVEGVLIEGEFIDGCDFVDEKVEDDSR
jgi:hypothetical protein